MDDGPPIPEKCLQGIPVAPGIAIAPLFVLSRSQPTPERLSRSEDDLLLEIQRFTEALARSERELDKIISVTQEKIGGESAKIFEAQILMMQDPALVDAVLQTIRTEQCNADYAVHEVLQRHITILESSANEYIRDRAQDFRDVLDRLVRNLQQKKLVSRIADQRIVSAKILTAADIVLFSRRQIKGCVMDSGGMTSHSSIMARALGVPAVIGNGWTNECAREDDQVVILDGFTGKMILNPTDDTLQRYRAKQLQFQKLQEEQQKLLALPAETADGHRVAMRANVELQEELPQLAQFGAEGVGLLRTEMMYLVEGRALGEEEQFAFYQEVVKTCNAYVTTFRLIDLGGDKVLPMGQHERNPFLGWRGIRILLDQKELLRPQLRAMLRASVFGPCRIMLPMVTHVEEVRETKREIEAIKAELKQEGIAYGERIQVGIMVEVPSVAVMADVFAREVDFFSLGTNDLTQYTLAIDRGNDLVARSYDEFNPAVLRLVAQTIQAAKKEGKFVGLCGELASNPLATPLLLGFGLDAFSMSSIFIPQIKRIIRSLTFAEAHQMAERALQQTDANGVREIVLNWFKTQQQDIAMLLDVNN